MGSDSICGIARKSVKQACRLVEQPSAHLLVGLSSRLEQLGCFAWLILACFFFPPFFGERGPGRLWELGPRVRSSKPFNEVFLTAALATSLAAKSASMVSNPRDRPHIYIHSVRPILHISARKLEIAKSDYDLLSQ